MHLQWSPEAAEDLADIHAYIGSRNQQAGERVVRLILKRVAMLADFPHFGRPNHAEGTRELAMPSLPYLAIYRSDDGVVIISRILHGAQDRPPIH